MSHFPKGAQNSDTKSDQGVGLSQKRSIYATRLSDERTRPKKEELSFIPKTKWMLQHWFRYTCQLVLLAKGCGKRVAYFTGIQSSI